MPANSSRDTFSANGRPETAASEQLPSVFVVSPGVEPGHEVRGTSVRFQDTDSTPESAIEPTAEEGNQDLTPPFQKKLWVAYLLALPPLGLFGAHHYYLGRHRMGIIYTLTIGICAYGWLLDFIRMHRIVKRINESTFIEDTIYADDTLLTWFPFGLLGLHRFYMLQVKWGLIYIFTLGFFGIGWISDAFRIRTLTEGAEIKRNKFTDPVGSVAGSGLSPLSQGNFVRSNEYLDLYNRNTFNSSYTPAIYSITQETTTTAPSPSADPYMAPPYPGSPDLTRRNTIGTSDECSNEVPVLTISSSEIEQLPPPPAYDSLFQ